MTSRPLGRASTAIAIFMRRWIKSSRPPSPPPPARRARAGAYVRRNTNPIGAHSITDISGRINGTCPLPRGQVSSGSFQPFSTGAATLRKPRLIYTGGGGSRGRSIPLAGNGNVKKRTSAVGDVYFLSDADSFFFRRRYCCEFWEVYGAVIAFDKIVGDVS